MDKLLKAAVSAFNEIPNKVLHSNREGYKDTYSIAAAIDSHFTKNENIKWNHGKIELYDYSILSLLHLSQFDNATMSPVKVKGDDCERCEENEADFFTIYLQLSNGESLAIADCEKKIAAELLLKVINLAIRQ